MKKLLLFALPLVAMLSVSCEKDKEEVWTDDSPIIEFTNLDFLSFLLKAEWYDHDAHGADFKMYQVDRNGDGQISEKEASVVKRLHINVDLTNIDEIKYFTALTYLDCSGNQLTTLDVSNNTALTSLDCSGNQLTTLDVSNNTALTYLDCNMHSLEKIYLNVKNNLSQDTINQYKDIIEYVE